jgi:AbrB family looped-hinge helix DNA binding protein
MAKAVILRTKVSTKGQIVLPKTIRDRRGWGAGAELVIEERPEGVLLRAFAKAEPTRVEDVFGSLGPVDRVISIEEMNEAVLKEARDRWLRKSHDRD